MGFSSYPYFGSGGKRHENCGHSSHARLPWSANHCCKPGLGGCCFLHPQNSEKVVKYMIFYYPDVLWELHQQYHCDIGAQELFQYLVKLILLSAQLYILPLLPSGGWVVVFVGLRMTKYFL